MNKLNQKLRTLLSKTSAPYSHFPIATILISKNKIVSQGVNVENVAYPSSICAEQNAIWASITHDDLFGEK